MSQSLARALRIMVELGDGARSLDQLAKLLDVHKSTALRLLQTMEAQRFVRRDDTSRYQLGSGLFDLSNRALESLDVRRVAGPHLRTLNERCGQTVHLAILEGDAAVYVDKYESRENIRMYSRVGRRAPLHCTAVGKVLLAWLPPAELQRLLAGVEFRPFTRKTITDPLTYQHELERVREDGYAADRAEHEDFITCVAAPVRDATGAVVAAASVSVPLLVRTAEEVLAFLPDLRQAAVAASADLGWSPEAARSGEKQRNERS